MRCAVFLPMPGARDSAAASPVRMARRRSASGMLPSTPSALLGPMPLTEVRRLNMSRSSFWQKPKSSMASSRTFIKVYSVHSCPAAGSTASVFMLHITRRPRPPAVITTASPSLFSIRVPFTIAIMSAPHFILNCSRAGPVAAWVSAMAMASAASSGRAMSCICKRSFTICCTCCFSALP